jgi:putative peptidoglycan lipid II flippase
LRTVSLLTLLSRVVGLVRDMAMAALFGNGAILDAFTVALRVPNLARRLFGEGALTAAFLPALVRELELEGRESAWRLASAVLSILAVVLCCLVLIGELLLWILSRFCPTGSDGDLLIGLTAAMLPYVVLICVAAQLSAVLHALGHFSTPAILPVLLNVVWLAAVLLIAPWFPSARVQAYVIALCIPIGGVLQLAALYPALARRGFVYTAGWRSARTQVWEITRAMLPVIIGLSITQLNTLSDSLIAWSFSRSETATAGVTANENMMVVLEAGTASALFFGQRMYQFPLGVFGVALGTVLFPLFARHAERGRFDLLRNDFDLGLRLTVFVGLPASAGLALLAEPITTLFFQRGAFDAEDARQTTGMISAYALGVWAYCGLPIVHRCYYAVGDRQTPLRVGLCVVLLNLVLNFTLLWPLGGRGLALATSISAMLQFVAVTWLIQNRIGRFLWRGLASAFVRAALATLVMSSCCAWTLDRLRGGDGFFQRLMPVAVPLVVSVIVYLAVARALGMNELWLLFRRDKQREQEAE